MKLKQITFYFIMIWLAQAGAVYAAQDNYRGKKVLYVNSYHKGYDWSDGELRGAKNVFAKTDVDLRVMYMDTKDNPSEDFCRAAGLKIKKYIDEFKPDVLITSDDNAFVYVVVPYFRDAALPVVFCGFNWSVSSYGAPYKNTTGMIEAGLDGMIFDHLRRFSKGDRFAILGFDAPHEIRSFEYGKHYIKSNNVKGVFVKDFASWKKEFIKLQDDVDMILLGSREGIKDWNQDEAIKFVYKNVRVPSGSNMDNVAPLCLISLLKSPEEQGEYAASAALRILNGEKPSEIPVVSNKKGILLLNFDIAGKLGIVFPPSMIKNAEKIIGQE